MIISMLYAAPLIVLGESILDKDVFDIAIALGFLFLLIILANHLHRRMMHRPPRDQTRDQIADKAARSE